MKTIAIPLIAWALGLCGVSAVRAEEKPTGPELKEGDRVVFIGNTFFEREGRYGYIETALTARYADRNITFRNLGWSGDTVWCTARAYFGTPEDGFKHLMEHVDLVKPTVIMLNYGGNEAFAGEAGLPDFIKGYERLLNELEKRTKRIILLSPTLLGATRPGLDIEAINNNRMKYLRSIQSLAERRGYGFIDITHILVNGDKRFQLMMDGTDEQLNSLLAAGKVAKSFSGGNDHYHSGRRFTGDPVAARMSPVRDRLIKVVIEKNGLFFHRHRPENETYLRGFRKHEQGNNAVEIGQFEPLIEAKEKEIAKLRGELLQTLQQPPTK